MNYDQIIQQASQYDSLIKANHLQIYVGFTLSIFDDSEKGNLNINIKGVLRYYPFFQTRMSLYQAKLATSQADFRTTIGIQNVTQPVALLPADWHLSLSFVRNRVQNKIEASFTESYSLQDWSGELIFNENGESAGGIGNPDTDFLYPFAGNSIFSTYTVEFEDLQFVHILTFSHIPEEVATYVSASVTRDGGGFVIINNHIHYVQPKSPISNALAMLTQLAELSATKEERNSEELIPNVKQLID